MIEVAGESFPTKRALTERCRGILYGGGSGVPLGAEDFRFLLGLLGRHRKAAAKIGCGVASFERAEEYRGTRHFVVVRVDGTQTDFSFLACITPPSLAQELRAACRSAVAADVAAFKVAAFAGAAPVCPVRGCALSWDAAHVDHESPSFEDLAAAFLRGCDPPPALADEEDGATEVRFADTAVSARFRAYHLERAKLRIVSAGANLSELRRQGSR